MKFFKGLATLCCFCFAFFASASKNDYKIEDSTLIFKEGLQTVERVFYSDTEKGNISKIVLPESVKKIDCEAFEDFVNLKEVYLPDSVTTISYGAFSGCVNLQKIRIPAGIEIIVEKAFAYCDKLPGRLLVYDGGKKCYGWMGNRDACVEVVVPDGVQELGDHAFEGCTKLRRVVLPEQIELGGSAFEDCKSLETINLPSSLRTISSSLFYNCSSLKEIDIPQDVYYIGHDAFYGCSSLVSVTMPASLRQISEKAFMGCAKLKDISVPFNLDDVENCAFEGCSPEVKAKFIPYGFVFDREDFNKLWEVKGDTLVVKEGIISLPGGAFLHGSYKYVKLPNSLKIIRKYTFAYSALRSISVPNSVVRVDENAFFKCADLRTVVLSDSVTQIPEECFCYCKELEKVTLGNNVSLIGNNTFRNCYKLSSINIPDSCHFGPDAFKNCFNLFVDNPDPYYFENCGNPSMRYTTLFNEYADSAMDVVRSILGTCFPFLFSILIAAVIYCLVVLSKGQDTNVVKESKVLKTTIAFVALFFSFLFIFLSDCLLSFIAQLVLLIVLSVLAYRLFMKKPKLVLKIALPILILFQILVIIISNLHFSHN